MSADAQPARASRRHFLKSTVGMLTLAACDSLGLGTEEDPLFEGPQIDEDDFVSFNAGYYGAGVNAATQLPYSYIRGGVAATETDPVSVAFRLQYLLGEMRHAGAIDTMLTHLLSVQTDEPPPNNYRNMMPRCSVGPSGILPATKDYSFLDNALLSSRVAMAAQAFAGEPIAEKALQFLDRQRAGYNQVLARSSSGFLPEFANASLFGFDTVGINHIFSGYYESIAFVLGGLIGGTSEIDDPQVGLNTWQAMIDAQQPLVDVHPASTKANTSLICPLARNGSGFQYFHALLALEPAWLDATVHAGLYNVLCSFLDAAVYDRVPGIYSAGPHAGGFFMDNGLNRLASKLRYQTSRETIITADALAAALKLFPEDSDERLILRGWIGLYASVDGMITPQGYLGGMDKEGIPIPALYARQHGAMILFKSDGARLLNDFMVAQGRPSLQSIIGRITLSREGSPIMPVDAQLPLPLRGERLFTRQ